jgi:hypothetical protein
MGDLAGPRVSHSTNLIKRAQLDGLKELAQSQKSFSTPIENDF